MRVQEVVLITPADETNHQGEPGGGWPYTPFPFKGGPLIGRQREMREIARLLDLPEVRLLTLTGTGGVGKTRLACSLPPIIRAAFPERIYLVALAALSDPSQVVPAIAQSLGITGAMETNAFSLLQAFCAARPTLLILDNFEHLPGATSWLERLLGACPELKILVTSRAVLHLSFEYEYPVWPLAFPERILWPDNEALRQCASVELFLQRARQVIPSFQLTPENGPVIAEICVRLDGLPLAIELAAARLKIFTPQMLLTRLSQRLSLLSSETHGIPARHQTLRANLDWSYHLLSSQEQRLLRWLAVFVGGCTLQAIEGTLAVSGDEGLTLLGHLTTLVENGLLSTRGHDGEEMRFFLLETIREYAHERLEQSGEKDVAQQAHADYYLSLMEQAAPELEGPEQPHWVEKIEQDHYNLRAGLIWFLEHKVKRQHHEKALRLASALASFWMTSALGEGCALLEQALTDSEALAGHIRAKALLKLGDLLCWQGQTDQAEQQLQTSLALARELNASEYIVGSLNLLGYLSMIRGAYLEAHDRLHESLTLARLADRAIDTGFALDILSMVLGYQGKYDEAIRLTEESLRFYQQTGNRQRIADAQASLGLLAFYRGELNAAVSWYEACLVAQQEVKDVLNTAQVLKNLGLVTVFQEDYAKARSLLQRGLLLRQERGDTNCAMEYHILGRVAFGEGNNAEAMAHYQESLRGFQQWYNPLPLAICLEGLAEVVAAQGQPFQAACLLGRAESLWQESHALRPPVLEARSTVTRALLSEQLGEPLLLEALRQGQEREPAALLQLSTQNDALTFSLPAHVATVAPAESVPAADAHSPWPEELTKREQEIFRLLAEGLTKPQIAERLTLSFHTVNAHVRAIYAKVGVSSRSAATRYALEHHLV